MNRRTALILSAGITGFLMMSMAGIVATTTANAADITANQAVVTEVPAIAVSAVAEDETAAQREADYRELIDEANQRIQQANAQIEKLKIQLQQARSANAAQTDQNTQYKVSPDVAAQFVLSVASGASLQADPELVDLNGRVAYEVVLDVGTVYVDANTGRVLQVDPDPAAKAKVPNQRDQTTDAWAGAQEMGDGDERKFRQPHQRATKPAKRSRPLSTLALLAVSSFAAVLSGWAVVANSDATANAAAADPTQTPEPLPTLTTQPMPTIMPLVNGDVPAIDSSAQQTTPASTPAPKLRSVTIRPHVAVTRSSR